jgi:membrane protein implicated in regulation of membrane protease activity
MTGDLRRALRTLVLPTLALLVVAAFVPGRLGPGVRAYALLVCVLALWIALAALRRAYPPAGRLRRAGDRVDGRRQPVRSLVELENVTALAVADAGDLHFRLRPRLRDLAAGLLEGRRGIALDAQPGRARLALGDETWDVVRADRPLPEDERAPGIPRAALERVVASLERL